MATQSEASIKDPASSTNVPVEGLAVTGTPSNPGAGKVLRQTVTIADGSDTQQFASVDSSGRVATLTTVNPIGQGTLVAVPAGTTNGTALAAAPTGAVGVRFYLSPGDSITYAFATVAPGSPPSPTVTVTNPSTSTTQPLVFDENLSNSLKIYVTAMTGSPSYRYV